MSYIACGVLGILTVQLAALAAIKRLPALKTVAWAAGTALVIFALAMAGLWPDRFSLPSWANGVGWALMALSAALLVHSIFFSLPFRKTYVATGVSGRLVTGGFYTLTRHPWLIWFVLLNLGVLLATGSRLMLLAAPVFVASSVLSAAIQDRFFFGRMFPGYDAYRRRTPMLLPNRNSLRAFVDSLKEPKTPAQYDSQGWGDNHTAG